MSVRLIACAMPLLLVALTTSPAGAQTASGLNTMIVLDGSNSMKGRLPGSTEPKFNLARTALAGAVAEGRYSGRLGLVGFGLRRPADCTDAAVILQPAAPDAAAMAGALERQNPGGYSPVFPALREAAKALNTKGQGSVVIVLDDLASCREDPCAVAAELKRDWPGLAVHVVGLGLRREDSSRLACLVRDTGGRLFDAQDADQAAEMMRAALRASAVVAAPAPPKTPEVEPDKPGLRLSVAIGTPAASTTIEQPVRYVVSRDEAGTDVIVDVVAPSLDLDLPPGRYVVTVSAGLVETRRTIEVKPGPAPRTIVHLDAGVVDVSAPLAKGQPASPTATVTLAEQSGRASGRLRAHPVILGATVSDLVLPAGTWVLAARDGYARSERVVTVTAGKHTEVEVPLDSGRLVVDVVRGSEKEPALVTVMEDDPDSPGGRREILRSLAPRSEFVIPAGSYTLVARTGAIETRERVSVRAGETTTRAITPVSARLAPTLRASDKAADALQWRLARADDGREVARSSDALPVFDVPPGLYRLEARLGGQNASSGRELELKAGSEQRPALDVPAGRIRLRLTDSTGGLGLSEVFWEITDDKGGLIWRTGQAEPQLTLAPGRYRVRAETRERVHSGSMDVRAGDSRTIEVGG